MAKNRKKLKISIIGVTLILLITFNLLFDCNLSITNQKNDIIKKDKSNTLRTSTSDIKGKPLLIHQYSTITNSFFPSSLPANVSFTLINSWTSQNVNIKYEGVSQKSQRVTNGDFNTSSTGWIYKSNVPSKYINQSYYGGDGHPAGCTEIDIFPGAKSIGDYGYYEQNISIPEKLSSGLVSRLAIEYYLYAQTQIPNIVVYLAVIIGNVEKNVTFNFQTYLEKNNWLPLSMAYDPSAFGQITPGNATIRVGVYTDVSTSVEGSPYIYFDNIKFELWTMLNEPNLVRVFDNEFGSNYSYTNIDFGKGHTFIDIERTRDPTNEVIFTIFSNKSDVLDFYIYNITIHSSVVRHFNTTISGVEGSKCTFGDNIMWETTINFSESYKYGEIWAEIIKPTDWDIIHVYDRDNIDRVGSCLDVGLGSNKATIQVGVMTPSNIERPWKIVANSENYILKANMAYWNGTTYIEESKITIGDIFQIRVTLNDSLILSGTQLNCTIKYPNDTIFWNDSKVISSYNPKFGNFTAGNNMTAGTYQVTTEWVNNQSYMYMDKAGFKTFNFVVWHHTNLTAIDSDFERMAGEPLLLKVKFIDSDSNKSVNYATITYNSTFGSSGTMVYQGFGVYISEIDTHSLDFGDYYFSFNASKNYYENQTASNLIHLKIVAEPLALEVPSTVINGIGNDYISCQINVTGAISGTLINEANISTDWINPYTVIDHNNGTYTLNFSTQNLPTQGIIETYAISIFANKTNYKDISGFITITISPIQTNIVVNKSVFVVDTGKVVDIKINYTVEGSEELIVGANCSVDWPSLYNLISDAQGFILRLYTTDLFIDTYTAIIKLEKPGYETAYKSITVIINRIEIQVNTMNFKDFIEAFSGDTIIIKINLTEPGTEVYIENATVFYSWEFEFGYFNYIDSGIYELELKLPEKIIGNYKMTLIISKEVSIYKQTEFSFNIAITEHVQPNYLVWYIIYGLLGIIGIFGIIGLRTYVFLPRKRRKESELLAKTQRYKDIMNIEALFISQKQSGLCIYSKDYYYTTEEEEDQDGLLTGFLHAITLLSSKIAGKEELKEMAIISKDFKGIEKMIELDFKHFNFLICDYKNIRITFILKEKASERFKRQIALFLSDLDSQISDKLEKWDGRLEQFSKILPSLFNQYFQLHYRELFKLNKAKYINQIKKEVKLSKMELRLLNVIISMTKENIEFYLEDAIKSVHEKNKDKVIEALESLIKKKIVISSQL